MKFIDFFYDFFILTYQQKTKIREEGKSISTFLSTAAVGAFNESLPGNQYFLLSKLMYDQTSNFLRKTLEN